MESLNFVLTEAENGVNYPLCETCTTKGPKPWCKQMVV